MKTLTLLLASAIMSCCVGHASALTKLRFQLQAAPSGIDIPFYYGKALGLYEKAGLDLEILPGRNSQDGVNAVAAGSAAIGASLGATILQGVSAGQKLVMVGNRYGYNVGALITGAEFTELPQLDGKRINVTSSATEQQLKAIFRHNGAHPDSMQFVQIPSSTASLTTFITGRSDGVLTTATNGRVQIEGKRPSHMFLLATYGATEPGYAYFTTPEVLQSRGDDIRRFLQVSYEAYKLTRGDLQRAAETTGNSVPGFSVPDGIKTFEVSAPFECSPTARGKPKGFIPIEDVRNGLRLLLEAKVISRAVDPSSFVDNSSFETGASVAAEQCP